MSKLEAENKEFVRALKKAAEDNGKDRNEPAFTVQHYAILPFGEQQPKFLADMQAVIASTWRSVVDVLVTSLKDSKGALTDDVKKNLYSDIDDLRKILKVQAEEIDKNIVGQLSFDKVAKQVGESLGLIEVKFKKLKDTIRNAKTVGPIVKAIEELMDVSIKIYQKGGHWHLFRKASKLSTDNLEAEKKRIHKDFGSDLKKFAA